MNGTFERSSIVGDQRKQVVRTVVLVATIALIGGRVALAVVDSGIKTMHLPDRVASTGTGLANPKAVTDPGAATTAVSSWADWISSSGGVEYLSAEAALWLYLAVDLLLIALPLAILLGSALTRTTLVSAAARSVAKGGLLCTTAFLLADALEDFSLVTLFAVVDAPDGSLMFSPPTWARIMGAASLLKWIFLAFAFLALLYAVLRLGQYKLDEQELGPASQAAEHNVWAPLLALRAPVIIIAALVALMLFLPGEVGVQVADTFIDLPNRPVELLAAIVGGFLFCLLLLRAGLVTVRAYLHPPPMPMERFSLVRWAITALIVIALSAAISYFGEKIDLSFWWAMIPPSVLCVVFIGLSLPPTFRNATPGPGLVPDPSRTAGLLLILAVIPLAVVAIGFFRGSLTLLLARHYKESAYLVGITAFLGLLTIVVRALAHRSSGFNTYAEADEDAVATDPRVWPWWVIVVVIGAVGGAWPLEIGEQLGPLAMIFLFLGSLLSAVTGLVLFGDRCCARGILALVGLRRVPFVAVVIVCAMATSYLNASGHYHDAELSSEEIDPAVAQLPLRSAFDQWITHMEKIHADDKTARARVPMVFIASAGGGIRAAYWTTLVTDCLFRDLDETTGSSEAKAFAEICQQLSIPNGALTHVFAASGISGGSVGLAVAHTLRSGPVAPAFEGSKALGPLIAALAFRDVPNAVLHLEGPWDDRGRILEMAWERVTPALTTGFAETSMTRKGNVRFPMLLLNGATVDSGCRLTVSVLNLADIGPQSVDDGRQPPSANCLPVPNAAGPNSDGSARAVLARTRDLFDYSCRKDGEDVSGPYDVPVSTAAHLSARFPYVSPSGALTSCADPNRRTFVVDGGVLDSSGASPVVELLSVLAPWIQEVNSASEKSICVEPRLILIDNGYADSAATGPPRRPQELLAPISAAIGASGGITAGARQASAISIQSALSSVAACAVPDKRDPKRVRRQTPKMKDSVVHLYPRLHPGPLAPLGWALSQWAEEDLRQQLIASKVDSAQTVDNLDELVTISEWFAKCRCIVQRRAVVGSEEVDGEVDLNPVIGRIARHRW